MKKSGKINYRKSLFRILMLMSSSALLVTMNAHASTISVSDMHKNTHHETMHAFNDDNDGIGDEFSDGYSNGKGHCDAKGNSGEHKFSPFCSDKPYGLGKNGKEWKPGWFDEGDHHYTPFGSKNPLGLEKHGHEWKPHSFKEDCAVVPVPAAVWLFGSGFMGLVGVARRKNNGQY